MSDEGAPRVSATERRSLRRARVRGLLRNRPETGPQTVHIDVANGCNTRCTTCWHHSPHLLPAARPSIEWKRRLLPFAAFREVLDDLLALGGLEQLILSGMGEPFVNPEIYQMVEYAHRHGIGVTIITNLLLADVPRLLASEGELDLLTSICGTSAEVWQAFHAHPHPRGFEALLGQLERLAAAGFRPKHVQVINGQNVHQLVEMVDFAARFPVERVNFKLASLAKGTEAVALDGLQRERLRFEWLPAAIERAEALAIETDLAAFARQLGDDPRRTAPIEEVGCFMGFLYCRVTVDLELLYCCNTEIEVGRITPEMPLRRWWSDPRYQALRDQLRAGRYFPGCEQCGKFKQNLKWSNRLRETLPELEFQRLLGGAPDRAQEGR